MLRKRAIVCVENPWDIIDDLADYSLMIVNPDSSPQRKKYLFDRADWSLMIDNHGEHYRNGGSWLNEKVFWYTSGTTGDSKFCSFTSDQINILANKIVGTYNINQNDRYYSIMPLWHAHGQGFYWATKQAKCEVQYGSVKDIKHLQKYNPTFVTAIPDVLKLLLKQNLTSLRFIRSASAPLSNNLFYQLRDRFSVPVIEAFGMTEALSHCFTNPLHGVQKIGSVGLPDGIEAKIHQDRLFIKGPTVCVSDWYDTGDLARVDDDGYYYITGRSKDQINVRGIKLNPLSLESQILENFPTVEQCVVYGYDSVNCMFIGDANIDLIKEFLSSMGAHCRPKSIRKVNEIPVSPSGKISRSWILSNYSNE